MRWPARGLLLVAIILAHSPCGAFQEGERLYLEPLGLEPAPIASDPGVRYDYPIVYVRAPRGGDEQRSYWAEIVQPALMDAGADLMLLNPDGSEELLVSGADGSIADPYVSFDGEWVYFAHLRNLQSGTREHRFTSADIFKIHVPTRRLVQLTDQLFTANTRVARPSGGVLNLGPCPLPGGRVMFVSSRNAFLPPKHQTPCLQLFVMDDDGQNVEQIGYLNLGMALHPSILTDGRVMFSSLESQGLRNPILWALWSIHPDGTNWGPLVSAFDRVPAPNAFHFQTQLSDGNIVAEEYYNQNNSGFGAYLKFPANPPKEYASFGPADASDPRNPPLRFGRFQNGKPNYYRLPFSPYGVESLTQFANNAEGQADPAVLGQETSPRVGKFTHPSGAPDNHLLTVWSPGPVNHQFKLETPSIDAGIYLIKDGKPIDEPAQMLLIKNDPRYNEQWPRALVPYERIYGLPEPQRLPPLANDGSLSPHLPAGTPFGLIGTASLYKRESYPGGGVREGSVTATFTSAYDPTNGYRGLDPFNTSENGASLNWFNQGADAGRYENEEIHAIRILAMEPRSDRGGGNPARFHNHANERLRILGEIPVRKFEQGVEPVDPDGNPDTSFLARIPANVAFTFQTLNRDGMLLNMSQTWHQLRPGEIRTNCGGCHAHSQRPTPFEETRAAQPDYPLFDLTAQAPLLSDKSRDQSNRQWDQQDSTGLRLQPGVKNVEYFRDVRPILDRSCAVCHTQSVASPPAQLVLDDDRLIGDVPGTYYRLCSDQGAQYGYKPVIANGIWRQTNASRYVRMFQSRRSLLVWKIHGRRTDGWSNDDFPTETTPGDPDTLQLGGKHVENTRENRNRADLDYTGESMPPPSAIDGSYVSPDGEPVQVPPLSDEEKRTIVRWIDLGCPIDLDYDPARPKATGFGWLLDESRPTLALTEPVAGHNALFSRILLGLHDVGSGLDLRSLEVTADFAIDGIRAGENLASRFKSLERGIWELRIARAPRHLERGTLTIVIQDRQRNISRLSRTIDVGSASSANSPSR